MPALSIPGSARLRSAVAMSVIASAFGLAHGKVVRLSSGTPQNVVNSCQAGDVLIMDGSGGEKLTDPPSGIQIVGGSAEWTITKEVSDLVLFNHTATFLQTGGKLRRLISNGSCQKSRFTHIDSVFFVTRLMHYGRDIEVDGFLRAGTFVSSGGYMGTSTITLWHDRLQSGCMDKSAQCGKFWTDHKSCFLVNATDSVGDGSGTFIGNYVSHGQVDWSPVRIINGRGITVAHLNSEYCDWSDPFVCIENGVECVSINHHIGGHMGQTLDWDAGILMPDGVLMYKWMTTRYGAWRVGGMNNALIGGGNYVAARTSLTGSAWSPCLTRDPYFGKWRARHGSGINFAPGIAVTSFDNNDDCMLRENERGTINSYTFSSAASCTTGFIDKNGSVLTAGLKAKSLRAGPAMIQPYTPMMPRIALDGDGPGVNMSTRTGAQILGVVNAGETVYLDAGTYEIPGTLTKGTVYGAGMDKTILRFPAGDRATVMPVGLYNLTIEGGTVGCAQALLGNQLRAANVRFRGQSVCGLTHGNAEQVSVGFLEFDNCTRGIATCADGIPCGSGGKKYDKFNVYNSTFKNLESGASIDGGTDGFASFVGCRFENISGTAIQFSSDGNHVAACEFVNCGTAVKCAYQYTAHNCAVAGNGSQEGFVDAREIISCTIMGCEPAVRVSGENALISDVTSDGSIEKNTTTWVGRSRFRNLDVSNGASYGSSDLSAYASNDAILIDQTPPTEPTGLKIEAAGANNVLTWNRSDDPETKVMHYIIERDGREIGRTNWNYSANFHYVLPEGWGPEGWQGPGVYRNPSPAYVDSGAAGTYSLAKYKVVAVNFAQIRSDNDMAMIRLWHHNVFPWRITLSDGNGGHIRAVDTVVVPLGSLTTCQDDGGKSYKAVRYSTQSRSGLATGVNPVTVLPGRAPRARGVRPPDAPVAIYALSGARVALIPANRVAACGGVWRAVRNHSLPSGLYVVSRAGMRWTVAAAGRNLRIAAVGR